MLSRFNRLFERYAAVHLEVLLAPQALHGPDGTLLGYVEQAGLRNGRFLVSGWAHADKVILTLGTARTVAVPHLDRHDVQGKIGGAVKVGFETSVPIAEGAARLVLCRGDTEHAFELPAPDRAGIRRGRRRLRRILAGKLLRLAPAIVVGTLRRDPTLRRRVRDGLDLVPVTRAVELDPRLFDPDPPPGDGATEDPGDGAVPQAGQGVSILLPVHNAFDLLPEVLEAVVAHTDLPWRLIVIEDCSSDARVRPFLRDWVRDAAAAGHAVHLIENASNLGFIGSVNAGFARVLPWGDPVVLLNSDAFVPPGWARRLVGPMLEDPAIATVTPMSNDAEIFSTPVVCARAPLARGQARTMDRVARRIAPGMRCAEAPTGVGFCMALNPVFLARVPTFDPVFGRGYGEEVDWCRKVAALGGRHVVQTGLFVEHRGGESFGSAEKLRLVQKNNAVISRRYPDYDTLVQTFIRDDPILSARLALALAFLDSHPDVGVVPVVIAHSLGGGAEMALQDDLARRAVPAAVILRMGGMVRVRIEVLTPAGLVVGSTEDLDFAVALVRLLSRRRVVYSCAVGDRDPLDLPDFMIALAEGDARLEILFHDYFPISPSYTLLDRDGIYRGPVRAPNDDPAHTHRGPGGRVQGLTEWQRAWGRAMARADDLVVFSRESAAQVTAAYPETANRVRLRPHALLEGIPAVAPGATGRHVIGVLGNIGHQKGADVLSSLSRVLNGIDDVDLAVIGNVDPAFGLTGRVPVHGTYAREDIPALVARYGITVWLIPSVWPETFSFTVHEALATGLPVLAFGFGAQGDAVAAAPNGHVVSAPPDARRPGDLARAVLAVVKGLPSTGSCGPRAADRASGSEDPGNSGAATRAR